MSRGFVLANLRALKRRAKAVPETARVIGGYAERAWRSPPQADGIGTVRSFSPRPYRAGETLAPIIIATPGDGHYMTTFFDIDPFSPSGRYLALTCVPFIHRVPVPGDRAQVCIVDLERWQSQIVYETAGWGAQLGANVQWGADDDTLFCNDVVDGRGTGIRIDRRTGDATVLGGPIYGLTPDKRLSFSGDLQLINDLIPGYGVPDPAFGARRQHDESSAADGIWRTDLETGECRLLISFADLVPQLEYQESLKGGRYHVFNVKVNPNGTRLFAVLFCRGVTGRMDAPVQLVTMDLDGRNPQAAMPDRRWRVGGHHPNWTSDGDHILMNLRADGRTMAFVRFRHDGERLEIVAPGHKGSGHPSLNPSQTHLLTDCYTRDGFTDAKGEVPLRLIDLRSGQASELCRVFTRRLDGPRRIDPHPVWSGDGRRIAFNGIVDGRRQVMIAEMSGLG